MGNALSDFDAKKKQRYLEHKRDVLREDGYAVPDENSLDPPDFADNRDAIAWFEIALEKMTPQNKMKLYQKKWRLGTGPELSYAERKSKSLLDPENPFPTDRENNEAEKRLLGKLGEHTQQAIGLKHGGSVRNKHFTHTSRQRRF